MQNLPSMLSLADIAAKLPDDQEAFRFHYALRHGTMKVGLYAPQETDPQGPHKQDELYIIVAGSGIFVKQAERTPFATHDVIFVSAGVEHHFESFTKDFATWVIFWGVEGGEAQ